MHRNETLVLQETIWQDIIWIYKKSALMLSQIQPLLHNTNFCKLESFYKKILKINLITKIFIIILIDIILNLWI